MAPRLTGNVNRIAGDFFGYDPTDTAKSESVLADYFPELKLSFGAKSIRGSRLGRAPQTAESEVKIGAKPQTSTAAAAATGSPITQTFQYQAPDQSGLTAQLKSLEGQIASLKEPKKETVPELTPEQKTIKGYYQQYLGREPQKSEITDWQGTGKTLAEIQTGLKEHLTSTASTKAIGDYYQQYLGRPAQESEIKDWQGTNKTLEDVKQGLIGYAQQQKATSGGGSAATPATYSAPASAAPAPSEKEQAILQGYTQYLGRTPAAAEVSNWLSTGLSATDITAGLRSHPTALYR